MDSKKWRARCAALYALSVLSLAVSPAQAYEARADGCAVLAAAIQSQVSDAIGVRQFAADASKPATRDGSLPTAAAHCGTTAAVASKAFSAGFGTFGMDVGWSDGQPGTGRGDACLSHYLEQCYPRTHGGPGGMLTEFQAGAVVNTWKAVTAALRRQMPFGEGSDIAYFSPVVLDEALAISLSVSLKPRYGPTPYCPPPLGPCKVY